MNKQTTAVDKFTKVSIEGSNVIIDCDAMAGPVTITVEEFKRMLPRMEATMRSKFFLFSAFGTFWSSYNVKAIVRCARKLKLTEQKPKQLRLI